jgi:hypothetical protein
VRRHFGDFTKTFLEGITLGIRIVRGATGPEAARAVEKVLLVDHLQHCGTSSRIAVGHFFVLVSDAA